MRNSRYSDSQILSILKQAEAGTPVPELCREHGMSSALFYRWRAKFGGMDASMMKRMKELEAENKRLDAKVVFSSVSQCFSVCVSVSCVSPVFLYSFPTLFLHLFPTVRPQGESSFTLWRNMEMEWRFLAFSFNSSLHQVLSLCGRMLDGVVEKCRTQERNTG